MTATRKIEIAVWTVPGRTAWQLSVLTGIHPGVVSATLNRLLYRGKVARVSDAGPRSGAIWFVVQRVRRSTIGGEMPKHECSFCHREPKLRVTPGDPDDPIGICIDCALKAVNILVAGAVDLLTVMERSDRAKREYAERQLSVVKDS